MAQAAKVGRAAQARLGAQALKKTHRKGEILQGRADRLESNTAFLRNRSAP
jgi:hypothetical protein